MSNPQHKPDPGAHAPPILNEADIGSGEKTPGEKETEEMIRQIPPLPPSGRPADQATARGEQPGASSTPAPPARP